MIDWQAFSIALAYIIIGFIMVESVKIGVAVLRNRKKKDDIGKYY